MKRSDSKTINVRLAPELDEWVRREATDRMVSVAYLVTRALERLRDEMPVAS